MKVRRELDAAVRTRIAHCLRARHAVGIELRVPGRIERVGEVDPATVAADLDHLGPACERRAVEVGRALHDPTDTHRACERRVARIRNVVLPKLPVPQQAT